MTFLFHWGSENLYLYFSRYKDYHTKSSISKAAYESALKDSVNEYRDRGISYSEWHYTTKLQPIQNEALKGQTASWSDRAAKRKKNASAFPVCLLGQKLIQ